MQTCITLISLIESKRDTTVYDVFILALECKRECELRVKEIDTKGCPVTVISVSAKRYEGIKQIAHISVAGLVKFDVCDIVDNYDKVIYLDSDLIIKNDLSELFEYDICEYYMGGVLEISAIVTGEQQINSGVLLMNLHKMRKDRMSSRLLEQRIALGDRGSMDQQTFNIVMKEQILFLPLKFNVIAAYFVGSRRLDYSINEINSLYHMQYNDINNVINSAVVIHYATGFKPWKYTYAPCGEIWYSVYRKSPFAKIKLKRMNKMQSRFLILRKAISEYGVVNGVICTINRYLKKSDKNKSVDWG